MEYRFVIEKFSPENLPIDLFCEAVGFLKNILGNNAHVHFDKVKEGCAAIAVKIDEQAEMKVLKSIEKFKHDKKKIEGGDALLKKYNTYGHIEEIKLGKDSNNIIRRIIEFEGAKIKTEGYVGFIKDEAEIDGFVIGNLGKDDTKHIKILKEDGSVLSAECNTGTAVDLLKYQYQNNLIRFKCLAKFHRDNEGKWHLEDCKIQSYSILENKPLTETIKEIRSKERFDWHKEKNPYKTLEDMRD